MIARLDVPPRSWLFVPGLRARELLPKALVSGTDAVILDLEDSVGPEGKADALAAVDVALTAATLDRPTFLRVNHPSRGSLADETRLATRHGLTGILVPKVASASEVAAASRALAANEVPGGARLIIIPMVESARGVLRAETIARADRVAGIAIGAEDLRVEFGAAARLAVRHARGHLAIAAVAAGRWCIDSPTMQLDSPGRVAREAAVAAAFGFVGKLAIHPAHVTAINAAFSVSASDAARAAAIVRAWDDRDDGTGLVVVAGAVVDLPVVEAARRLLARAGQP